jgi:hypothetical protein
VAGAAWREASGVATGSWRPAPWWGLEGWGAARLPAAWGLGRGPHPAGGGAERYEEGAEAPERRQRLLDAAAERTPSADALDWSGPAREGAIHGRMELVMRGAS